MNNPSHGLKIMEISCRQSSACWPSFLSLLRLRFQLQGDNTVDPKESSSASELDELLQHRNLWTDCLIL